MERFGRLARGESHMSVSLAPDSQSVFSVKCIIFEGRESCTCNQDGSEATLRSHLCRSSARRLAQRTCPAVRAGYYCYGHHQRMTPNRNRGYPGPAQHNLASRCTTTTTRLERMCRGRQVTQYFRAICEVKTAFCALGPHRTHMATQTYMVHR